MDFSVNMLQECYTGDNLLIMPYMVMEGLALLAFGAKGETKTEIERVLCKTNPKIIEQLLTIPQTMRHHSNDVIKVSKELSTNLPSSYKINPAYCKLMQDMGITMVQNNSFTPGLELKLNLEFLNEWDTPYKEEQIKKADFYLDSSNAQTVDMMYGKENRFIHDFQTTGFMKSYAGNYSFVALLPAEGITMEKYLSELTGARLTRLLFTSRGADVHTGIPKFEHHISLNLTENLYQKGIKKAMGADADFSGLLSPETPYLYIDDVRVKTINKFAPIPIVP